MPRIWPRVSPLLAHTKHSIRRTVVRRVSSSEMNIVVDYTGRPVMTTSTGWLFQTTWCMTTKFWRWSCREYSLDFTAELCTFVSKHASMFNNAQEEGSWIGLCSVLRPLQHSIGYIKRPNQQYQSTEGSYRRRVIIHHPIPTPKYVTVHIFLLHVK